MLEVRGLQCERGDHLLFTDLSFSLNERELLHVRGSNGSGKTTLLRTLCGLLEPQEGEILWRGVGTASLREEFFAEMTYLGHLPGIKEELTAVENLSFSSVLAGAEVELDSLWAVLGRVGLSGREDLPCKVLSQGQKRRVALARLLLSDKKLWVLDEPYMALDVSAVALIQSVIKEHVDSGGMVIMTTHQDVDGMAGVRHLDLKQ